MKTLLPRMRYFLSSHLLYCINPHSTPDITFISPSPVLAVEEVLMASSWSLPQESNSLFTKSSWASVLRRERYGERQRRGQRRVQKVVEESVGEYEGNFVSHWMHCTAVYCAASIGQIDLNTRLNSNSLRVSAVKNLYLWRKGQALF
jgi:hypothetical protein